MNLKIGKNDPFNVLGSTKAVVKNAKFVFINEQNLKLFSDLLKKRFEDGLDNSNSGDNLRSNLKIELQTIFLEDAVNFCFWAGKSSRRWQIEKKGGAISQGGWYGLKGCFERALQNKVPILDASYIATISDEDGSSFFEGINNIQIPLLMERLENLREAGRVLIEKLGGEFINLFRLASYDAVKIVDLVIQNFSSFRDVSVLAGKEIFFFKRAQILAWDINCILKDFGQQLSNLDQLTAFADYKLPQILRNFNVIEYSKDLAEKIDNYVEISHNSREELEIRAATIWSIELLTHYLPGMISAAIDSIIWLMSQDNQERMQPYHRTRTTFY